MTDTLVKICGISTPEALDAAVYAGASHVGFVHFAKSPRHVDLMLAASLAARVPASVESVLLVVNMDEAALAEAVSVVKPAIIQFHGAETPDYIARFKNQIGQNASGVSPKIWKAIGVKSADDLAKADGFAGLVDRVLYDAPAQKLPGGNGLAMDWSLLQNFKPKLPWALAGGLNPANVAQAIAQTGAPLVDTSSGVESAPGVKDMDRIRAFCQAAHRS